MPITQKARERVYFTPPEDISGHDDPRAQVYVYEDDLLIDQNVQRPVRPEWQVGKAHDWNRAEVVTCTLREDGVLVVTEGQNRLLLLREQFPGSRLWVVLQTDANEAGVALDIARARQAHNPYDQWQLRLHRGDEREVLAELVLRDLDLELSRGRSTLPGRISAVGSVRQIMSWGDPVSAQEMLRRTLSVLKMAFGQQDDMWESYLIRAAGGLIRRNENIDTLILTRVLRELTPRDVAEGRRGSAQGPVGDDLHRRGHHPGLQPGEASGLAEADLLVKVPAKSSLAQQRRRQDKVVELTIAGCSVLQIAAALSVTRSTVSKDRQIRAQQIRQAAQDGVRKHWSKMADPPDPEPYDWVSDPVLALPPSWKVSGPVVRVQALNEALAEMNALNRLAFNVKDAEAAGDEDWFAMAQIEVRKATETLAEMEDILIDARARHEALRNGRADVLVPPIARPGQPLPLVPPGRGIRPGRVFTDLMGYEYAGIPVGDKEIGEVANRQNAEIARVWQAWRELQATPH